MQQLVLQPLADAFLMVGVPVAILAAVAAWARIRYGDRLAAQVERHARLGPLLGALMGVIPGCGTAIVVVLLWARGSVSYGTAVAALTATMGDAAFLVIAVDPALAAVLHACLFASGLAAGYAVDAVRYDARSGALHGRRGRAGGEQASATTSPAPVGQVAQDRAPALALRERTTWRPGGLATAGGPAAVALPMPLGPAALWLLAALGTCIAVPDALQLLDLVAVTGTLGVDPWLLVGGLGTLACIALVLRSDCAFSDDTAEAPSTLPAALTHGAKETAFVVTWVSVAFVAQALLMATGFDGSALPLTGAVGVLVAVAVAVVPGCGTQIAFTGLYVAGVLPFPALLANAVAQDGDALMPLLAVDRRAAVVTTVLTSVPALAAGLLALALT